MLPYCTSKHAWILGSQSTDMEQLNDSWQFDTCANVLTKHMAILFCEQFLEKKPKYLNLEIGESQM